LHGVVTSLSSSADRKIVSAIDGKVAGKGKVSREGRKGDRGKGGGKGPAVGGRQEEEGKLMWLMPLIDQSTASSGNSYADGA